MDDGATGTIDFIFDACPVDSTNATLAATGVATTKATATGVASGEWHQATKTASATEADSSRQ